MSNYQRINANSVALGENKGQPSLKSANENKLNVNANIVANNDTPVITYTDSSNTIDFHNKPVVNFTGGGGGGGGDAFLNGGTALVTPQEFTGFNKFDNDTQFADGLSFTDNGIDINGRIHASASALHLQTNNALDTISMKLDTAGSTNTLELKQDPSATTQNALFIQQDSTSSTLDKVLTNSTQDLGVIVDAVEASPNTFTNTNTFSASTTTTGITNTGGLTNSNGMVNTGGMTSDVLTCQGLLSTQSINSTSSITSVGITNTSGLSNTGGLTSDTMTCQGLLSTQSINSTSSITSVGITNSSGLTNTGGLTSDTMTCQGVLSTQTLNASQNITGNQVLSNGDITCGVGSNFIVGSAQIASSNLSDSSSLLNTSATQQTKSGNLIVSQLTSSAGVISFTLGDGANIQNDTTNNILVTSTTNATDGMNWRLGTDSVDTLRLRYDANGGGAGVARYFLEMLNPTDSTYYAFSGSSPYDVNGLVALLNNTSLTFNPTTTLISQGVLSHSGTTCNLINGTGNGTLSIGNAASTDAVFFDAQTTFREDVAVATTKDIFSPDLDGGTKGVIEVCDGCVDRTLTSWQPTITSISPVTGYINNITNLFVASFVRVRFGTNFFITMRGGFAPSSGTFPSGNFTVANMGSTYAPANNQYFSYQKQPGVPPGMINLTPTGDFILIGLNGNETEVYLGGIQYFVN